MNPVKEFPLSRKNLYMVGILAALFITIASVWGYLAFQPKQVEFIHNGVSKVIETKAETVEQFLSEQQVSLDSHDLLNPGKDSEIKKQMKITYTDKWQIEIQESEQQKTVVTNQPTVDAILKEQGIVLNELDRVEPAMTETAEPNQKITITRVEKKLVEEPQLIPFNEVTRKDDSLAQGQKKVIQEGAEGKAVQQYEVVYENGTEVSKQLVDTKIIQAKKDRVVAIGTLTTVSRGGATFIARKILNNVTLTAYSAGAEHTGKEPGHPQYAITASGKRAQEGRTIAVDPSVIPMGTWVYIEGIGYRRAEDKGSAVKGNKIDIYFEENRKALSFGKRRSKAVYVIGKNKPQ